MTLDNKLSIMFMHQLQISNTMSAVQDATRRIITHLTHVKKLCAEAWRMTKEQTVRTQSRSICSPTHVDNVLPENCSKLEPPLLMQTHHLICQPRRLCQGMSIRATIYRTLFPSLHAFRHAFLPMLTCYILRCTRQTLSYE